MKRKMLTVAALCPAFAAALACSTAALAGAPLAPSLVFTGGDYNGEVFAESRWLDDTSMFHSDFDEVFASDVALANGIGAASFGEGVQTSASALGAIGFSIGTDPNVPNGGVAANGFVEVTGSTQALGDQGQPISDGDARALSELTIHFDIQNVPAGQTQQVVVQWLLDFIPPTTGDISGSIDFTLEMDPGSGLSDISHFLEIGEDPGLPQSLSEAGLLLELTNGSYTLRTHADLGFNEMQGDTADTARGDYSVQVNIVPEPTTAALLAFAGVTLLRRRRA